MAIFPQIRRKPAWCYFEALYFVSQLSLILDFAVIFYLVCYQVATIAFYGHTAQACITRDLN